MCSSDIPIDVQLFLLIPFTIAVLPPKLHVAPPIVVLHPRLHVAPPIVVLHPQIHVPPPVALLHPQIHVAPPVALLHPQLHVAPPVAVLPLQLHAGARVVQCVSANRLPRQVRLHVSRPPRLQRYVLQCFLPCL